MSSAKSSPLPARATRASAHTFACGLAAENIQTINKVQHTITVDAIIGRHRTGICCQRTADITLLFQNIVHFKTYGSRPFQERLRKLSIPDQLHCGSCCYLYNRDGFDW